MVPKLLTENGWKAIASKNKIKDNGLQRALSVYEKVDDDKHDDRLKAIASVSQLASALKKAKEVAAVPDIVKYLLNLLAATQSEQRMITQAKTAAEKAEAITLKKAEADAKKQEQAEKPNVDRDGQDEQEDETGDSYGKLAKALQTLKTSKVPYYFLFCKDKPYGLVVSKKDITKSAQHKKELAKMAGGSTSPPKFGQCRRESSKLIFEMEKPVPGMARILQKWIKDSTGLGLKVMVGTESADDEQEQPQVPERKEAPGKTGASAASPTKREAEPPEDRRADFKKARAAWVAVKNRAEEDLEKVKEGARMAYIADASQFPKIVQGCKDIDDILDNLDDELRDTLDQYASTPVSNQAKLLKLGAMAKEILDRYRKYVANNAVMKAIDMKEFANVTIHAPVMKALGDLRRALS